MDTSAKPPAKDHKDAEKALACIVHGASVSGAGTPRNASSMTVKTATGTSSYSALAIVDVPNNPLDVGLLTTGTTGAKTVEKLVDKEYFPGYGRSEHTVVSTALPSATEAGPIPPKNVTAKTWELEEPKPSSALTSTSAPLTGAKSRSVTPNWKSGEKTLL